jgi:hypothetical protein
VLQMPITQASERMGGFSIVLCSGAVQAMAFACLFMSAGLPWLVAAVTLLALAQMLAGPLVQTIITELAPRSGQATYQAAFGVVNDLKDAAGPQSAPGSMRSRPDCRGRAVPSYRSAPRSAWPWPHGGMTNTEAPEEIFRPAKSSSGIAR